MAFTYRNYAPNQGLEAIQARIFNQANVPRNVTPEEIQERFEREKIDPKTVVYAFNEQDEPVAYIQARDYPDRKEVHLGYPWSMPDCPLDVQKKMFSDLLTYLKTRDSDLAIRSNTQNIPKFVEFVKTQGFIEDGKVIRFEINLNSIANAKADFSNLPYTLRKATMDDYDAVKIAYFKALGDLARQDNENFNTFVKQCIESGFMHLAIYNETIVGACTNTIPDAENIALDDQNFGLQFFFTHIGEEKAISMLMRNAIEIAVREQWNRDTIRIGFTDENSQEMDVLTKIAKDHEVIQFQFKYL
ncbi:MAG: hypothetical protein E4G98_00170 [Promethearchaeota archaeon]|nr:MAG: hypothetical protein E4G98_00170 [Candidatus Lokiarchaeota archaeon]